MSLLSPAGLFARHGGEDEIRRQVPGSIAEQDAAIGRALQAASSELLGYLRARYGDDPRLDELSEAQLDSVAPDLLDDLAISAYYRILQHGPHHVPEGVIGAYRGMVKRLEAIASRRRDLRLEPRRAADRVRPRIRQSRRRAHRVFTEDTLP